VTEPYRTPGNDDDMDARLDAELKAIDLPADPIEGMKPHDQNLARIRLGASTIGASIVVLLVRDAIGFTWPLVTYFLFALIFGGIASVVRGIAGRWN
jgi:hypothetical protein